MTSGFASPKIFGMDKRPRPIHLSDPLKHFAKDHALVKLLALVVVRAPLLLMGYALGKWPGWWP